VTRTSYNSSWYPVGRWDWFYGRGYWWFGCDYDWYPGWGQWGYPEVRVPPAAQGSPPLKSHLLRSKCGLLRRIGLPLATQGQ